jgi:hypothetical protein
MKKTQIAIMATLALLVMSPLIELGSAYYTTDPIGDAIRDGSSIDMPYIDIVNFTITHNSIMISVENGSYESNGHFLGLMFGFTLKTNITTHKLIEYAGFGDEIKVTTNGHLYLYASDLGTVNIDQTDNNTLSINFTDDNILEEPTSYSQINLTVNILTAHDTVGNLQDAVIPSPNSPTNTWNNFWVGLGLTPTIIGIIVIIGIVVFFLYMNKR